MNTATLLLVLTAALATSADTSLAGRWDAVVIVNNVEIPFRFDLAGNGDAVTGSFFDGTTKLTSKPGTFTDGNLTLAFAQYAATLQATLKDGELTGTYNRASGTPYTFHATRHVAAPRAAGTTPSIAGVWKLALLTDSSKGEKSWRFIARQSGPDVSAAVLRVDGDTGTLTGTFADGKLVLSHFSGARPSRFEVTPLPDGTLEILQNGKTKLTAVRAEDPRAKDVAEPSNPATHTRWKDANERLRFAFNDLAGKPVSDTDPRFQGKVLLVNIAGSWCPNCRDEAPFLSGLYRKYHKQGLEVVALAFEESDQLANPTRLRDFIKEYGIGYTVLLAGEPGKLAELVPQADNLNAFPTTFIIGRDGKVRGVHAGFPSPASGEFYSRAQHEVSAEVERLLAERPAGTQ